MVPHEHIAGANHGDRHFSDIQGAVAKVVPDLLHIILKKAVGERPHSIGSG
jgi:hypothetical protein